MNKNFRETHLLKILNNFSLQSLPLDVHLRNYFKSHKSIGSHDRKFLAETIYSLFRWLGLVDYMCQKDHSWEKRIEVFKNLHIEDIRKSKVLPDHIAVSFPRALYEIFAKDFGKEIADELCLISNTQAPTTIRANPLKTSREHLLNLWRGKYQVKECDASPLGIIFLKRENFFGMPEFKDGLFEVQDEGSQLISFLVKAKPGQQVLDFCSGSGGKTLGFAHHLGGKGQIYLHDIRPFALAEAKKRLKRAGIQNSQIMEYNDSKKKRLKNSMDWVLVDGPCSGSGTLRRNPDMKWRFDPSTLPDLIQEQRDIFKEALSFVKPGGHIVYSTCSILPEENSKQIEYFISHFDLTLVEPPLETFPSLGGMDGFYGAILQKKNAN